MSVYREEAVKLNVGCAEYLAWFRKTYRPSHQQGPEAYEFERDLDRLVMEINSRAYREAQHPFVMEFHALRDMALRSAAAQVSNTFGSKLTIPGS